MSEIDDQAARLQELLQQLPVSGSHQSVGITREIKFLAERLSKPRQTAVQSYSVGDRVRVKISLSPSVVEGSRGNVTRVLVGNLYDVLFDEKPDGSQIAPPSEETVADQNLESA